MSLFTNSWNLLFYILKTEVSAWSQNCRVFMAINIYELRSENSMVKQTFSGLLKNKNKWKTKTTVTRNLHSSSWSFYVERRPVCLSYINGLSPTLFKGWYWRPRCSFVEDRGGPWVPRSIPLLPIKKGGSHRLGVGDLRSDMCSNAGLPLSVWFEL